MTNKRKQQTCCGAGAEAKAGAEAAEGIGAGSAGADSSGSCCGGARSQTTRVVPQVSSEVSLRDRLGALRVRLGIGRMNYRVEPGLYAAGEPGDTAPVCVTANYKMSFDLLRKALASYDAWILVLDTRGVNVWCAAGKGSFGTEELIRQIERSSIAKIVSRKRLILPQLGAPGVHAAQVTRRTGFGVSYGPVRAADLPFYFERGWKKTEAMRTVEFPLAERLKLVPMEITGALRYTLPLLAVALGIDLLTPLPGSGGAPAVTTAVLGAVLAGQGAVPLLLPYFPFRSFALKGAAAGIFWMALYRLWYPLPVLSAAGIALVSTALAALLALGFTGATPFTSQTATVREVHRVLPVGIAAFAGGAGMLVYSLVQGGVI